MHDQPAPSPLIARPLNAAFRAAAAARAPRSPGNPGARAFHPDGIGYSGLLVADGDPAATGTFLARREAFEATIRFSRALGLPPRWPDILGIALRLASAHGEGRDQDLLFASSASPPILRHVLVPGVRGFFGQTFTTLTPYRLAGKIRMLAISAAEPAIATTWDLDALAARAAQPPFELCAAPLGGRWSRIARVRLDRRLPGPELESMRFNPHNTGGGFDPAGPLMGIRDPGYKASQDARLGTRAL